MASLGQFNSRARELGGREQYRAVVLSVHGIKTTGPWQKSISPILQKNAFLSVPVDYGFNLFRILGANRLLRRAIDALWTEYQKYYDEEIPFCAIGHSFGTLAIGNLLSTNRDARFDRIILAGCVLPVDYDWDSLLKAGQVNGILNEVSKDDAIVRICGALKLWFIAAGQSGREGFECKHRALKERTHRVGHSGVLSDVACKQTWVPFLRGEEI